jgi:hypothetical protein
MLVEDDEEPSSVLKIQPTSLNMLWNMKVFFATHGTKSTNAPAVTLATSMTITILVKTMFNWAFTLCIPTNY